jgi:hypothetical protein
MRAEQHAIRREGKDIIVRYMKSGSWVGGDF